MNYKVINIPLIKYGVAFFYGKKEDLEKGFAEFNQTYSMNIHIPYEMYAANLGFSATHKTKTSKDFIVRVNDLSPGLVAHEMNHTVYSICENMNIRLNKSGEEIRCKILEHLVDEALNKYGYYRI